MSHKTTKRLGKRGAWTLYKHVECNDFGNFQTWYSLESERLGIDYPGIYTDDGKIYYERPERFTVKCREWVSDQIRRHYND